MKKLTKELENRKLGQVEPSLRMRKKDCSRAAVHLFIHLASWCHVTPLCLFAWIALDSGLFWNWNIWYIGSQSPAGLFVFWDQLCSSPARVIISNFSHYPRFCPFLYLKTDRFNLLIGKNRDQRVEANKWKFIHNLHMLMQLQNFNFILLVFCFYCSKSYHLRHLLLNIWYCINCLYLALIMIIFCIFILIYLNYFSTTEY